MKQVFKLKLHDNTWTKEQIINILYHDGIVHDGVIHWGLHKDEHSHSLCLHTKTDFKNYKYTFRRYDLHRATHHTKLSTQIELTDNNYLDKICTLTHLEK